MPHTSKIFEGNEALGQCLTWVREIFLSSVPRLSYLSCGQEIVFILLVETPALILLIILFSFKSLLAESYVVQHSHHHLPLHGISMWDFLGKCSKLLLNSNSKILFQFSRIMICFA